MTAPAHAGWPGVSKRPSSPGRAEVRQEKRSDAAEHDGSSDAQPYGHARSLRKTMGLNARRRRIWRNGTFTSDVNVGWADAHRGNWSDERRCRFGYQANGADERREHRRAGLIRRLHRAVAVWVTGRFVTVHRTHRVCPMSAGALGRLRIRGTDPPRDWHACNRDDLTRQPTGSQRHDRATQTRHQTITLALETTACQTQPRSNCARDAG
jgi:hypothetical protein